MTWTHLLKRVFDIDIEQCACAATLKLVAVIDAVAVIEQILTPSGLAVQPLFIAPPRQKAKFFRLEP